MPLYFTKQQLIVIGASLVVIASVLGYSVVQKKMAGEVVIKRSAGQDTRVDAAVAEESGKEQYKAVENEVGGTGDLPADMANEAGGTNDDNVIMVHVAGRVKNPGLVKVADGSRLADAVAAAGGFLQDADVDAVNLAVKIQDGQKIYIPSKAEKSTAAARTSPGAAPGAAAGTTSSTAVSAAAGSYGSQTGGIVDEGAGGGSAKNPEKADENFIVNINNAGVKELDRLPGVGPSTALKIIEHRNQVGRFDKIEDIMEVSGIGPAKFEAMKKFITVR